MRNVLLITTAVILATVSVADDKNVITSGTAGISIELPVTKKAKAASYQIAMFYLPPADGFAANVNVQKQEFKDTIEAYHRISLKQFKQLNAAMLKQNINGNEIMYEFRAEIKGRDLHFYVRAVQREGFVYLITATGLESQWGEQKTALMKSVDSFKLTK